jgi:hypothetical protein
MRSAHCILFFSLFFTLVSSCSLRLPVKETTLPYQLPIGTSIPDPSKDQKVTVWLLADTLHTSLAFPYDWLRENGYRSPEGLQFKKGSQRTVMMSWGNRKAYMNRRWLNPLEVVQALFMPSPSVTEIIPITWKIEEVCNKQRIYRAEISRAWGAHVAAFLNATAKHNEQGLPIVIGDSSWGQGYLLDCPHSYFFPRICNIWTGQCLEACGLKINISQAISAGGVIRQCESQGFQKIHDGVKK